MLANPAGILERNALRSSWMEYNEVVVPAAGLLEMSLLGINVEVGTLRLKVLENAHA